MRFYFDLFYPLRAGSPEVLGDRCSCALDSEAKGLQYNRPVYPSVSWHGSQGPFEVLGYWFFNKRPFISPFIQSMGPFWLSGMSVPLLSVLLKSICGQYFKVGVPSNSILRTGSCIFAAVPWIAKWLLEAEDTPAMLQSRETTILGCKCVPTIVSWY